MIKSRDKISKLEKRIDSIKDEICLLKNRNWMDDLPLRVRRVLDIQGLTNRGIVLELLRIKKIYPYCYRNFGRASYGELCSYLGYKNQEWFPTVPFNKRPWK